MSKANLLYESIAPSLVLQLQYVAYLANQAKFKTRFRGVENKEQEKNDCFETLIIFFL